MGNSGGHLKSFYNVKVPLKCPQESPTITLVLTRFSQFVPSLVMKLSGFTRQAFVTSSPPSSQRSSLEVTVRDLRKFIFPKFLEFPNEKA